ncbi:glycosyltransferase family 4 protein [Polaribacter aestuariivivens]|uniref:Glycosyltransferase family 4 protein n=1 Tax=Polaribacter aestuariivivens TaxID=2304626 RepID=A0A5S3NB70_9FLAO|nr:glycosyltransferase [Polaribacter aestuariivivens]TMM32377.1 glycosyltransferase family 4 protein [Polaribacter aestuariivivens]
MQKKSLLIIGYVWVEPNSSAAGKRMLQLIHQFLERDYKITFASPSIKNEKAIDLKTLEIDEVSIELNNVSFDIFVKDLQPEIVLFDRFMMEEQFGWRVAENCPKGIRILDTEDLHCLRKTREVCLKKNIDFSIDELLRQDITKREIASILRCDLSLIISNFEMELLKNTFKIDESILIYLPFLFDEIDKTHQLKWKNFEKREHFIFIGNFFHKPNVDAVLTLKNKVWNKVRKQLPKAELHIYGAYVTQQIEQLHNKKEGFIIKGFVEDANEVVGNAKVVLAPINFGAGIKGKLTEAMLCGTPSVTTSIGVEGMSEDLYWNGFVEDDFIEFSKKAIILYLEKKTWEIAQNNGVNIINNIYSKEKNGHLFFNKIEKIQYHLENHRTNNFMGSLLQYQTLQATKYMSKWIEAKNKK